MIIYFDSFQEGAWFQGLHRKLTKATLLPFPSPKDCPPALSRALAYDRPDIVVMDESQPILILERTTEVPSGHNVGQRFARLVAGAQMRVPIVYFGPYAAYKHGGITQGPRYMNLRLFVALSALAEVEKTSVTCIRWPVDKDYEIVWGTETDKRLRDYLNLFFELYSVHGLPGMLNLIRNSDFEKEQQAERDEFVASEVDNPDQYNIPPKSVEILEARQASKRLNVPMTAFTSPEIVLYKVGMTKIRSDPFAGMAMLYCYHYCGGLNKKSRNLILAFPSITIAKWKLAARRRHSKTMRIFRMAADGVSFMDGYLFKSEL